MTTDIIPKKTNQNLSVGLTFEQFLDFHCTQQFPSHKYLKSSLLEIAELCKRVAHLVRNANLTDNRGKIETLNSNDEQQAKIDVLSNNIFLDSCTHEYGFVGLASEEMEEVFPVEGANQEAGQDLLLMFDPLDGSSNLEINAPVGSIFSMLRKSSSGPVTKADFMQTGDQQMAAGYCLYGAATVLVITIGSGVHEFTYDWDKNRFYLTQCDLEIPNNTCEYAINASNHRHWEEPVQRYIDECVAGKTGPRNGDFNTRWFACLVLEIHRILMRGGIFLYPIDQKLKDAGKAGRLRLLYECNPMSFLVEQAGGLSTTGYTRVMDQEANSLHQRSALIIGAQKEVERVARYHDEHASK